MHVVIFRSTRLNQYEDLYRIWSEKMGNLVMRQPGYQSHFSYRDNENGQGVTVSYFDSEESIKLWQLNADHVEAQIFGRTHFYESFVVDVAEVNRHYEWRK